MEFVFLVGSRGGGTSLPRWPRSPSGWLGGQVGCGGPSLLPLPVQKSGMQWAQREHVCFVNELICPFLLPVLTRSLYPQAEAGDERGWLGPPGSQGMDRPPYGQTDQEETVRTPGWKRAGLWRLWEVAEPG